MARDPWEDFFDDPQNKAWAEHVKTELIPMIRQTAMTISLIPTKARDVDLKFAVELGLSVMLDKPIIAVVTPGTKIPEQLRRLAEEIVEWDGTRDVRQSQALFDAIERVKQRHP